MKSVMVTGPGLVEWVDVAEPVVGPKDVLIKIRACGICGSDAHYTDLGGIAPSIGHTPLGHEPAGEVVEIGPDAEGDLEVGDHVVIKPHLKDGLLGSGGEQGALSPYVVVKDYIHGEYLRVIPKEIPWEVAALNEPMAVAHHAVNRSDAKAGDTAVVFGAGPVGMGAVLSLKSKGVKHVVMVARGGPRAENALRIGADAVIDSTKEDVTERLIELHGLSSDMFGFSRRAATDVYIDAAGSSAALEAIFASMKWKSVLSIVSVQKDPYPVQFNQLLLQEIDIRLALAYPTEIFEVTDAIIASPDKYRAIISDIYPYEKSLEALEAAKTPGATTKVVITFD